MNDTTALLAMAVSAMSVLTVVAVIVDDAAYPRSDLFRHKLTHSEDNSRVHRHQSERMRQAWAQRVLTQRLDMTTAHELMQLHRECRRDECPSKQAAYEALVATGRIRPATTRMS